MQTILLIFTISALGYLIGTITIKNVSLGTSAVLLVALFFGHFGFMMPSIIKDLGLSLFVGSVGLLAGPVFFRNFKSKVFVYLFLGVFIIVIGSITTILAGKIFDIPPELALGIFTGAMTSTPALAAATEISQSSLVSIGYGIAYPFGVLGVVIFVQILPRILGKNMEQEVIDFEQKIRQIELNSTNTKPVSMNKNRMLDTNSLLIFSFVMALGLALASLKIPLPNGLSFSLGMAGGPLFAGLIVGHYQRLPALNIKIPISTLTTLRELGLMLFLLSAGIEAGSGFIQVVQVYGWTLFLSGAGITMIPIVISTIVAMLTLKLDILSTLGCICGGMTSTPALGTLISSTKTEDVAVPYAATYPFAMICVIIATQLIYLWW